MFKKITIPLAVIIAITIFGIYASKTKTNRTVYAGVVKGHIALLDPETGSVQDSFPELSVNRILDYFDRESFLVAVSKKPSEYFNPGGDVYDIYKLNLKTREKELLLGSASQAYLSPTREQLAYVQNRTLKILDLKSGESEEVAREIIFYPGFPKPWSPDGQKLAYTLEIPANKARNYVYDLTTKNYLALIPEDEEAHPYVLSWDQQKKIIAVYNPESEKDTVKIVKIGLDGTKEVVLELPTTGAPTIEDISNNLLLIRYSETNSLTLFDLSKKDGDPKKVLTINDPNYRAFANILPNGNVFFKEIRLEETEGGLKEHRVRTGLWRKSDEQLITLPEDVESIGG
ncbi:MAG: hypothetical protein HPY90_15805 [Syntrophothermus sp.]|uniref:hypothetical protein n=1 Tax=Syntrophothermus sp. TaxID=2736299 RepID=UPI00257E034C|nr:hypothetical protein [Syntrophothermus sp.]NSW84651.1 hypothetical protein [Syntrophothermus sp.]